MKQCKNQENCGVYQLGKCTILPLMRVDIATCSKYEPVKKKKTEAKNESK